MECLNYYKMPLHDNYPYIMCYDSAMAFNWLVNLNFERRKDIINKINGLHKVLSFKQKFFYKEDKICYINNKGDIQPLLLVRGWGHLIGGGGYNLPPKKAKAIQDEFAEYIVEQLNK